jgi:hypothetical protein
MAKTKLVGETGAYRVVDVGECPNGVRDYRLLVKRDHWKGHHELCMLDGPAQVALILEDPEYPKWLDHNINCYVKDVVKAPNRY